MRSFFNLKSICSLFTILFLSSFSSISLANPIDLYEQPKDGKPIATVNSDAGIISIFTPKNSDWVKVADPANGNVGWVKSKDLENATVQMNMIQTTNNGHHYQMIQYKHPSQQLSRLMQQQSLEMQQMIQELNQGWGRLPTWYNEPTMIPIFILPVKEVTSAQPTSSSKIPANSNTGTTKK